MSKHFLTAFDELNRVLNSRKQKFYPEHGNPGNHQMCAFGPSGEWLVSEHNMRLAPGETRQQFAASLVWYDPEQHTVVDYHGRTTAGKRPVAVICHRLYQTDVVQLRYDGAVKTLNYDSPTTWRFIWNWCPVWARPHALRNVPKHAESHKGKSIARVLVAGNYTTMDVADLWLAQDDSTFKRLVAAEEFDLKARTTFTYKATVMSKAAKKWRRENKARVMQQFNDARAMFEGALSSGVEVGAAKLMVSSAFEFSSWQAEYNMFCGEPAKFFDRVMLDELGYFQAYEQVEKEFTL